MSLPEALELWSYLAENPPTHRAMAIVHRFEKKKPSQTINVSPDVLKAMAPGGLITSATLAGIPSGGRANG